MSLRTSFAFVIFIQMAASTFGADISLVMVDKKYDPRSQSLDLILENRYSEAATAWTLELIHSRAEGRRSVWRESLDSYYILIHRMRDDGDGPIAPGGTRVQRISLRGRNFDSVDPMEVLGVRVVSVVFSDATSQGDERAADRVFLSRRQEMVAARELLDQLLSVSGSPMPRRLQALDREIERLEQLTATAPDPTQTEGVFMWNACAGLVRGLRSVQSQAAKNALYAGDLFDEYLESLRHRLREGVTHLPPAYRTDLESPEIEVP